MTGTTRPALTSKLTILTVSDLLPASKTSPETTRSHNSPVTLFPFCRSPYQLGPHSLQNLIDAPRHGTRVISSLQLCDLGTQPLGSCWKTPQLEGRFHSLRLLDSSAARYRSRESLDERTIVEPLAFLLVSARSGEEGPSIKAAIADREADYNLRSPHLSLRRRR